MTGIVTWRELTFVFKQTVMFKFYGETPDDDGLPIFNEIAVDLPSSIEYSGSVGDSIVVGNQGVYFVARDGVYQTTGGPPKLISDDISPIFSSSSDPYVDSSLLINRVAAPPALKWAGGRLFLIYTNAQANIIALVWDEDTKAWTRWSAGFPFASIPQDTLLTSSTSGPVLFLVRAGFAADQNVYRMAPSIATDIAGTAIDWNYTSGYYDLGTPGEKRLRYTDVYGSGTVTAQMLTQGARSAAIADAGSALTLGTLPAIGAARRSSGARGRLFAHKLSGSGRAAISRIEHRFAPGRIT